MLARNQIRALAVANQPAIRSYHAYRSAPALHATRLAQSTSPLSTTTATASPLPRKEHAPALTKRLYSAESRPQRKFADFELDGRVFVVTGGARGLGLTLAEALIEGGAHVHCLDRLPEPSQEFHDAVKMGQDLHWGGDLHYERVDVQDAANLDAVIGRIADKYQRLDGLVAAAGVQNVTPALEYSSEKVTEMMDINFKGVYLSATSCARQMVKYKIPGTMLLVGSMSGLIANKGLITSVYNSSKAAVIQLGRSLSMEWGKIIDGKPIRVNVLCPGNIMTPMVRKNFEDEPHLRELWERENMLGRISEPREYRGAALFLLSDASSFMTGSHLVIDGGYTAW